MEAHQTFLKWGSWAFFLGYTGLLVVAGGLGALFARADVSLMFDLDLDSLSSYTETGLLSQYRFLRAIEFGFGLFALLYRNEIHRERAYNRLFLTVMAAGIIARVVGVVVDGSPPWLMYMWGGLELVGIVFIYLYTRRTLAEAEAGGPHPGARG